MLQSLAHAFRFWRGVIGLANSRSATLAQTFERHARWRAAIVRSCSTAIAATATPRPNACINRHAHAYRALGLRAGDVVALLLDNRPEFLWHFLAAGKLGADREPDQHAQQRRAAAALAAHLQAEAASIVGSEHAATFDEVRASSATCARTSRRRSASIRAPGALPAFAPLVGRGERRRSARDARARAARSGRVHLHERHDRAAEGGEDARAPLSSASAQGLATMALGLPPGRRALQLPAAVSHATARCVGAGAVICDGATLALARRFSRQPLLGRHAPLRRDRVRLHRRAVPLPHERSRRARRSQASRAHRRRQRPARRHLARVPGTLRHPRASPSSTARPKATSPRSTSTTPSARSGRLLSAACSRAGTKSAASFVRGADGFLRRAARRANPACCSAASPRRTQFDGYHDDRRDRAQDRARRVQARRRLVQHRRSAAHRRQAAPVLRRPPGRHVPLEGRERLDLRGAGAARVAGRPPPRSTCTACRCPAPRAARAWPRSCCASAFDAASFKAHVDASLPRYARPLFVRVLPAARDHLDLQAEEGRAARERLRSARDHATRSTCAMLQRMPMYRSRPSCSRRLHAGKLRL